MSAPAKDYECVLETLPQKPIILRSKTETMTGKIAWAWVPTRRGLKKMQVFLRDGEPEVKNWVIENFSGKAP